MFGVTLLRSFGRSNRHLARKQPLAGPDHHQPKSSSLSGSDAAEASLHVRGKSLMPNVRDGRYKDQASIVLENEMTRAEFVAQGARMVSLRDKRIEHEFLFQQEEAKYVSGRYGEPMANNQAAGYDDMFPTIGECFYQHFPWKGTLLPGHGEVSSLYWDMVKGETSLTMSCRGVRLPYKLTRRVTMPAENQLRFDYKLENLSSFPISYLWSAHPILRVEEGARILLPEECRVATSGGSLSGRIGRFGHQFTWPICTDERGNKHDLSLIRSPSAHDGTSYFFIDRLKHGWCGMKYPSVNRTLTLSFPPETVPFVGVILGECIIGDPRFLALLEPCTAPFGRLDNAHQYMADAQIPAAGAKEWFLAFSIESA